MAVMEADSEISLEIQLEIAEIIASLSSGKMINFSTPPMKKILEEEVDRVCDAKALREVRQSVSGHYTSFAKRLAETLRENGDKSLTVKNSDLMKQKVQEKIIVDGILDKTVFIGSNLEDFVGEVKSIGVRALINYDLSNDSDGRKYNIMEKSISQIETRLDKMLYNTKTHPNLKNIRIQHSFYTKFADSMHGDAYRIISSWENSEKKRHAAIGVVTELAKLEQKYAEELDPIVDYAVRLPKGPTTSGKVVRICGKVRTVTDIDAENVIKFFKEKIGIFGIDHVFKLADKYDLSKLNAERITEKYSLAAILPAEIREIAEKTFEEYDQRADAIKGVLREL